MFTCSDILNLKSQSLKWWWLHMVFYMRAAICHSWRNNGPTHFLVENKELTLSRENVFYYSQKLQCHVDLKFRYLVLLPGKYLCLQALHRGYRDHLAIWDNTSQLNYDANKVNVKN